MPFRAVRFSLSAAALLALCGSLAGCGEPLEGIPAKVDAVSGDNQCGAPGTELPEPLVVRVLGPRSHDIFGRRGVRIPVADVEVTFQVEGVGDGPVPGDGGGPANLPPYPVLLASPGTRPDPKEPYRVRVRTDPSGLARAYVRLGRENGDWRVEAVVKPPGRKDIKEHFRTVCGVLKLDVVSESRVGEKVPLSLKLVRMAEDGRIEPLPGRTVFFRLVGYPLGAESEADIDNARDITDAEGIRSRSNLVLGDRPGVYRVLAEVEPLGDDKPLRGILYEVVANDWLRVSLEIAAGILLFLMGVRFLGTGFLLLLSRSVHLVTGPLSQNRLLGYAGGVLAGATFQSASTVTSYLMSFANGGLLTARGALGLLAGACLGATVLPQLLALDLDFLIVPLFAAGLLAFLLPRKSKLYTWAWVFLGGGLVLAAWELLGSATELLALSETFRTSILPPGLEPGIGFLTGLGHFGVYFLLGTAAGTLLRTSNLLVVLALLFAASGIVTPYTAVPWIAGANLGSGFAIFLRSLFKLREARRVAGLYLIFHLAGAVLTVILAIVPVRGVPLILHFAEAATPGRLLHPMPENLQHHLAMVHTAYNLLGGLALLVAPGWAFRLLDRRIPPRASLDDVKPYRLDENLIPVPSLALRQAAQETAYLTELCQKSIAEAFDAFRYGDLNLAEQVVRREEVISGIHRDLAGYLVLVAENQLSRHDAVTLEILQTAAGDLARIGEAGERLRDLAARRVEEGVEIAEEVDRELSEVYDLVMAQFDNILTLLTRQDSRLEESTVKITERLAKYRSRLEAQWRQRIEHAPPDADIHRLQLANLIYQEAFEILFRVASHLAHIAQRMRILSADRL